MRASAQSPDRSPVLKVVVVGDSGVGKSCLLQRFFDNEFRTPFVSTLGVDFRIRSATLANGEQVRLQIWDTAGQERFRTLTKGYFRGAHAILLVYAVNSAASFEALPSWLEAATEACPLGTVMAVVASKCDADQERTVSQSQGQAWAAHHSLLYYEVSAKSGAGVKQCFAQVAEQAAQVATLGATKETALLADAAGGDGDGARPGGCC